MWALYAQRDAGIAIKSSVQRVLNAFVSSKRSLGIAKVNYDSQSSLSAMTSGVYDSLLIKRHAFHHENEVRIMRRLLTATKLQNGRKKIKNAISTQQK
jgi:hypothetical protein